MLLKDTFEKDIYRSIDPVVKANETEHLRSELEEFVVTNEVKGHLLRFFDEYNDPDAVGNGAWISGFFGSGKSHLLKILAVALEDREVAGKRAMDYLVPKVSDVPALAAAMQTARERHPSESVLFNIDSFAPNAGRSDSGALLAAFIKAFNHHCGYFDGDQQHIAKLEYDLDRDDKLGAFKESVERRCGKPWEQARKSALLYKRHITAAFDEALGNPEGTTKDALGYYKDTYKPDIRSFAQLVKDYIDSHGSGFRLNFFVDEVGQFIAQNTNLMVNLQSVAEELNTTCEGASWVIVTSQENMEDIVGQMKAKSANDFSKIQARFRIKMTLTSSDAKEVIRDRLLAKKPEDEPYLESLYDAHKADFDVLFDFADGAKRYKQYQDLGDFESIYPFVPYQFEVFMTALRGLSDHNCFTGRHNSTGARSMLGVFQLVAERICDEGANTDDGTLAPFDLMFEGLRNDLKSEVYAAVSTAEDQLDDEVAVRLLKALLLVKYCQDFRATPGNLRVLLYGAFSESTSELNGRIKDALDLLERQVYVRRNGNVYEYLTNDEKEVEQEIANTAVPETDIRSTVAQLYRDVCGAGKVTYTNGQFTHSYSYNLRVDGEGQGIQRNDLTVDIVMDWEPESELDTVVPTAPKTLSIALRNARNFLVGLRAFKQTERYCNINSGSSDVRAAIIHDKQVANGKAYERLRDEFKELLADALFNAGGVDVTDRVTGIGKDAVESAALELVRRSYTGLQQIGRNYTDNDVYSQCITGQQSFGGLPEYCETALSRIRMTPGTVTVAGDGMGSLTAYFIKNEYGWPEVAVRSAVATLYAANKVEVRKSGSPLEGAQLADALKRKRDLDKLTVFILEEVSAEDMARLQKAFRDFAGTNPKQLDIKEISSELESVATDLAASMGRSASAVRAYPFASEFSEKLATIEACAKSAPDRAWVVSQFPKKAEGLAIAKDDLTKMKSFADGSPMSDKWHQLKSFADKEAGILSELGIDEAPAQSIRAVVDDPECYKSGKIPSAYKQMAALRAEIEERLGALKEESRAELGGYRQSFETMNGYSRMDEDARRGFDAVFDRALSELDELVDPYRIKQFAGSFKVKEAAVLLALLQSGQGQVSPAVGEDGGEKTPSPTPSNPPKRRAVPVASLKATGYTKPVIQTREDVEAYIAALREEMQRAIENGDTVIP